MGYTLRVQYKNHHYYGSEFYSSNILQSVFENNLLWENLKSHLIYVMGFPLSNTRAQKHEDVLDALIFRNHKGMKEFKPFFDKYWNRCATLVIYCNTSPMGKGVERFTPNPNKRDQARDNKWERQDCGQEALDSQSK